MNLPAYLLDYLADTTGVDYRVTSRKARRVPCPNCRAWTLRALDGDVCAADAQVDPTPLTPLGEAVAQLAGIGTWTLRPAGGRLELDPRDTWTIRATPAGSLPRADIVPGHECGRRWFTACTTDSHLPANNAGKTLPDNPPF